MLRRRPDKGRRATAPRPGPSTVESLQGRLSAPEWRRRLAQLGSGPLVAAPHVPTDLDTGIQK